MSQPSPRKPLPISIRGSVLIDGPLVVPSFSSKGLPRISVEATIEATANYIVSPILLSAYDIRHHKVKIEKFKVPFVIVDSGGYELLVDQEGKTRGGNADHPASDWSEQLYYETLDTIKTDIPIIAVSYDHANRPTEEQIDTALAAQRANMGSSFLMKPELNKALSVYSLKGLGSKLNCFDMIGVTEKEAGSSLIDRLKFIFDLRMYLDDCGVCKPIHVFGALDPIITPLFFLAGADIVDGLTWLRFEFSDSGARYLQSRAATTEPTAPIEDVEWIIRRRNYIKSVDMQVEFQRYLLNGDYGHLYKIDNLVKLAVDMHKKLQFSDIPED